MNNNGFPKEELERLFAENVYRIDESTILEMNRSHISGEINNVVVGLTRHCYGLSIVDDSAQDLHYNLFYINGENTLEGYLIELRLQLKLREYLTFYFSGVIADTYGGVDVIDVFNTFQSQTRTALEKVGFVTIDSETYNKYENPTFVALGKRGIIIVNFIDRLSHYRDILGVKNVILENIEVCEHVYLMLNKRNGLVKIGKSKDPRYREKTLQSDEPEIEIIGAWPAPATLEKDLHKKFAHKRKRGEWFELDTKDIMKIQGILIKHAK